MDFNFVDASNRDFDPRTYLSILIAIAKADKDHGPPEFNFVRQQADRVGLDYDYFFKHKDGVNAGRLFFQPCLANTGYTGACRNV